MSKRHGNFATLGQRKTARRLTYRLLIIELHCAWAVYAEAPPTAIDLPAAPLHVQEIEMAEAVKHEQRLMSLPNIPHDDQRSTPRCRATVSMVSQQAPVVDDPVTASVESGAGHKCVFLHPVHVACHGQKVP
jgi:hypothetical protein